MATIRLCSVPGCGQPHKTRGYCVRHYQLWRRHGDPLKSKARFFPGVSLREKMTMFTTVVDGGCWIWHDIKTPGGYGVVSDKGRTEFAHRAAWRLTNGEIPSGLIVSHLCHCPSCVRPDHLFLETHSENITRSYAAGRGANGSRHHMAKLTDAQAKAILHSAASSADLAQEHGVSQSLIRQIRARKIWRHID